MEPWLSHSADSRKHKVSNEMKNCSEVRDTGIKTKHILIRLHGRVLWLTLNRLQAVSASTMTSLAYIISLFKFSPHICKHGGCNCSSSTWCPPSTFLQSGVQWWNVYSIFYILPIEQIKWWRSGWRWPSNRAASTNPFLRKLLIEEVLNCNVKCRGSPACWNSVSLGPLSSEKMADGIHAPCLVTLC
jgi:hypothetical protein